MNRLRVAAALLSFVPAGLWAQTPTMTLNSLSLTADPVNSDGYTLQGTFSGLSFGNAQSIILSVGQFAGELAITDLVQQPGTHILTYQDSTGLAPAWLSSLTLDLDAQTFTASAKGIVLTGLPNPFAIQLGTDSALACTMARVRATDQTTWQLTASDGNQNPCSIATPPQVSPSSLLVNTPTDVQFQTTLLPTPNLDPTTIQLFRADSNGQPVGAPLCQLQTGDGGNYSCVATFAESNPGLIPLVIQASAGANLVLSPGFSLLVVQPVSQEEVDALSAVSSTVTTAWQENFASYGNSAQARVQTLAALRTQALPGVAQIRLLEDGLSIGVLLSSGMPYMMILNRINDGQGDAAPASSAPSLVSPRAMQPGGVTSGGGRTGNVRPAATAGSQPLTCGSPQRPVVKNNQVIVWKSPFFPEPTTATLLAQQLQAAGCPGFAVTQVDATMANAKTFPNYGTVIIDSHGANFGSQVNFLTNEVADLPLGDPRWDLVKRGLIGAGSEPSLHGVSYITLPNAFFATLPPFQQTLTFASACSSAYGGIMASIFAANGGAYYGFTAAVKGTSSFLGVTIPGFSERISTQLFDQLLKNYVNAADAYQSVDHNPLPSESLHSDRQGTRLDAQKGRLSPEGLFVTPPPQTPLFVLQPANSQLAYLGNPVLLPPQAGDPSYPLAPGQQLNLQAHLDGAAGCDGTMNYHWTNTAKAGHLTAGGGQQDDFTVTDSNATYQASSFLQGIDTLTVDFFPDASQPPVARACGATDVARQTILHVVFDGHGVYNETILPDYYEVFGKNFSADESWHAAWDIVLSGTGVGFPGALGQRLEPPLPGSTLSGSTVVNAPNLAEVCSGPPVADPTHDGFTAPMPQTPLLGIRYYDSSVPASSIVQMWAETFGGYDYRLCDGHHFPNVGSFPKDDPGYPGFDTLPGYVKFDINLNDWVNQPDHSITLPVMADFYTVPGNYDSGETHVTGTIKLTSRSVNLPSASSAVRRAPPTEKR